jgi:Na+/proline symporter
MHTFAVIVAVVATVVILLWLPVIEFIIKRKKSNGKLTLKQYVKELLKGIF